MNNWVQYLNESQFSCINIRWHILFCSGNNVKCTGDGITPLRETLWTLMFNIISSISEISSSNVPSLRDKASEMKRDELNHVPLITVRSVFCVVLSFSEGVCLQAAGSWTFTLQLFCFIDKKSWHVLKEFYFIRGSALICCVLTQRPLLVSGPRENVTCRVEVKLETTFFSVDLLCSCFVFAARCYKGEQLTAENLFIFLLRLMPRWAQIFVVLTLFIIFTLNKLPAL